MTKQDTGCGIQDAVTSNSEQHRVLNPESRILDPASMQRVRWRCRRGLLELDIVLGRFIEHYAGLDEKQRVVFDYLLDLPDTELWDLIGGKLPALQAEQRELLGLINSA